MKKKSSAASASTPPVATTILTDGTGTTSPVVNLSGDENSEDNSFDHNDEMSMSEVEPSGDEALADSANDATGGSKSGKRKRGKKLKKTTKVAGLNGRKRSDCWNIFEEVKVPSSGNDGETQTKAKCKFCLKYYAYTPGGVTSHLLRHMESCKPYQAKLAKKRLAMNFLAIPASSVSSESTFSAGGRVLSDYRSSLKPSMVEALICASSWIRGAAMTTEEDIDDDVENIPFPKSEVQSN